MKRTVLLYSVAVAAIALALEWLEYQYVVRLFPIEVYVGLVALFFTALGIWVGYRLIGRPAVATFEKNQQALQYLGITDREVEVLELLAEGRSNREIGESLFVSPNTVKTHLASLYGKLEVSRRTQAVQKARSLRILP